MDYPSRSNSGYRADHENGGLLEPLVELFWLIVLGISSVFRREG